MAAVRFVDIALVVMAAPVVLLMGAPALGFGVGAGAWCLQRAVGEAVDRRLASVPDARRALTLGLVWSLARVWLLALIILAVGKAASRQDGLTAALVVLFAFTVYFSTNLMLRSHHGRARTP